MTRWLVTGAGGMLGQDLVETLRSRGHEVLAAARADLDITDPAAVTAAIAQDVDVVVNAAAYTNVDGAESHAQLAELVNGTGPALLAQACAQAPKAPALLQVSTDYVFDGTATTPYSEDGATNPVSEYGRSKLLGEQAVLATVPDRGFVVRTAWLYGAHGPNFVATMQRLERERETVDVVMDQRGQPTSTIDLALRLAELGERALDGSAPPGIYHGTASGETTWYGLARAVFAAAGADPDRVRPTTTDKFPRPAPRPAYSVLGHRRWELAGLAPMRAWDQALPSALAG